MAMRWITRGATALAALFFAAYGWFTYELSEGSAVEKLACIQAETPPVAWTCGQLLRRHRFTPTEIAELNKIGGSTIPLSLPDKKDAEDFLSLLISNGVDVNAVTESQSGWTPLHMVITQPEEVQMLLKHGARTDIKTVDGETPLDLARRLAAQGRPGAAESVKLLSRP
jgi:hypothetical protein